MIAKSNFTPVKINIYGKTILNSIKFYWTNHKKKGTCLRKALLPSFIERSNYFLSASICSFKAAKKHQCHPE